MLNNLKQKLHDIYFARLALSIMSGILLLLIIVSIALVTGGKEEANLTLDAKTIPDSPNISYDLIIKQDESADSQYESIKTTMFSIIDKGSLSEKSYLDGTLSVNNIKETLENYLQQNKYKVMSIGLVNNKFYIQQDTSKPVDYTIKVGIVGLGDSFSADDWTKLTEAIYSKFDVDADSLFSASTDIGNKHFIYAYQEEIDNSNAEGINSDTNTVSTEETQNINAG